MRYNTKVYYFWDDNSEHAEMIFSLRRGAKRRNMLREIIIEVLRKLDRSRPTTKELQKLTRIRRATFLPLLKDLQKKLIVERHGSGTRSDPFKWALSPLAPAVCTE